MNADGIRKPIWAVVFGGWLLWGGALAAAPATGDGLALPHNCSSGAYTPTPPDASWVNDVAVDVLGQYTTERAREQLMRDYDPDLIDWDDGAYSNAGRWFTMRGVRIAGGAWNSYFTEIDRNNPLVDRLAGNGLAVGANGYSYIAKYDVFGLCPNAPKTRGFAKQGILACAPFVDALCQDNFGVYPCYCPWCNRRFREYLTSRYSAAQLRQMGAADVGKLELRSKPSNPGMDFAWRTWVYGTNLEVLGQAVSEARSVGRRHDKYLPFWGNISDHFGLMPLYLLNSQLVDVIWLEVSGEQPQFEGIRKAWSALGFKVSRGAGAFRKPVWAINRSQTWGPNSLLNAHADAAMNGAIINATSSKVFAQFVHSHRSLFVRRQTRARVAVVWSLPSRLAGGSSSSLNALGTVLENAHIPYEVVVFGATKLWDDREALARLSCYDLLVLPEVVALTEKQDAALQRFLDAGKGLVAVGACGACAADGTPRPSPILARAGAAARHRAGKGRLVNIPLTRVNAYLKDPRKPVTGDADFVSMRDDILWALGGEAEVQTTAPETVWLNVWEHEGRRKIAVHLVNYDIKPGPDLVTRPAPFEFSLRLPKGSTCDRVRCIPLGGREADLPHKVEGGRLTCTVPSFDVYTILVLTTGQELDVADALANGRKYLDRLGVASGTSEWTKSPSARLLSRAQQSYLAGDFVAALAMANDAAKQLDAALRQVVQENVQRERDGRRAAIDRARGATRAFDFGGGPVAPGFQQVTASTVYSPGAGCGWQRADADRDNVDRGGPDDLHRDFVTGQADATFLADVPDGLYRVTVLTGDSLLPYHRRMPRTWCDGRTNVYAGNDLMLLGIPRRADVFEAHPFAVKVRGGKLALTLQRKSRGPWQINGLLVEPLSEPEQQPQDELRTGALRDWLVLGPFDDSSAQALSTPYPPEQEFAPARSYRDKNRELRWLHYVPQSSTGFCRVAFDRFFCPNDEVMAYAVTHIQAHQATKARLSFGSTGRAVVWLNGERILEDAKTDGLYPDEFVVDVALRQGWNRLLVKVCRNWFREWAFAASLAPVTPNAQAGFEVSALGDCKDDVAPCLDVNSPQLDLAASAIELGGQVRATARFRNSTGQPLHGSLGVTLPEALAECVKVGVNSPASFSHLAPGAEATCDFTIALLKPVQRDGSGARHSSGPGIAGPRQATIALQATVRLAGHELRGEPILLDVQQPKVRLWAQSSARVQGGIDVMTAGRNFFGYDRSGGAGIRMGGAPLMGHDPEVPHGTLRLSIADPERRDGSLHAGPSKEGRVVVDEPGRKVVVDKRPVLTPSNTTCPDYEMETQLEVRSVLPCLFVTARLCNLGAEIRDTYQHWTGDPLTGYSVAGAGRSEILKAGSNNMVSDGWVFVNTEKQPPRGYGLIVPGTAGYRGATGRLFINSSPGRRCLKQGEAHEIKFVLVGTEDPNELAAIAAAAKREQPIAANVLVSNPMSRRLEATLSLRAPEGWRVLPPQVPVSLEPGQAVVIGFTCAAGSKAAAGNDPLEAVLLIRDAGELRERANP